MSRVFMSSHPPSTAADRDFSSAVDYGRLEFVLPAAPPASAAPDRALALATERLADFDPLNDFLAFGGGDPASLLVCGIVLGRKQVPYVNFLRWERKRDQDGNRRAGVGFYLPVRVNVLPV